MPKKSSITLFIAATSALAISSSVNSGENDMGGLKEWNTDMDVEADFVLDREAQKIAQLRSLCEGKNLNPDFIAEVFRLVMKEVVQNHEKLRSQ